MIRCEIPDWTLTMLTAEDLQYCVVLLQGPPWVHGISTADNLAQADCRSWKGSPQGAELDPDGARVRTRVGLISGYLWTRNADRLVEQGARCVRCATILGTPRSF